MARMPLLDNLTFGSEEQRGRVVRVLRRMELEHLEPRLDEELLASRMPATVLAAVHLARAFVTNPEVPTARRTSLGNSHR